MKKIYLGLGIVLIYLFFLFTRQIAFSQQSDQEEATGSFCGPYALMITAETFGVDVNMSVIGHLAQTTSKGTSMKGLADAAHQLGFRARGMKLSLHDLVKLEPPIIAYVNPSHYLVIEQIFDEALRVVEIDRPAYLMSFSEFAEIWEGYVLTVSPQSKQNEESQPHLQADQFAYDFGILNQGESIEYTFTFKNTGTRDLVIRDVIPGCHCSWAKASKKVIPPGEEAELSMSFNIETRWGKASTSADIISNDPDSPVTTFTIKGIAKTLLPISPKEIELGRIANQNKKVPIQQIIHIQDPGVGDLVIRKVETSSSAIQAKIFQVAKGADINIHLLIVPDECFQISPEGRRVEEYITIYTNDKKSPQVKIPIRGEIGPVVDVNPERFFFGFVKQGEAISQSVTITNHEQGNLKIIRAAPSLEAISVEVVPVTPGQEFHVNAKFQSNQANKSIIQGKVTIFTDHPKHPFIDIPVYAIIQ